MQENTACPAFLSEYVEHREQVCLREEHIEKDVFHKKTILLNK